MTELQATDPNAFVINGSSQSNEPRKKDDEGKETHAHGHEEEHEVDPEHPMQVDGKLLIWVDSQGQALTLSLSSEQTTTAKEAHHPVPLRRPIGGFQSILYCRFRGGRTSTIVDL